MSKTNAARVLDSIHIEYELKTYEVSGDHQSAEDVAMAIGV
jgi:Cys-tRNA(Pro)/Cys-tRNA(Cys) deacylase